jgi:L-aminopeptidase/D-esterase-like protein
MINKKIRARDLGIILNGDPGELNEITDVPGVEVGHSTIIKGKGPLILGKGPIRTGVTMILPKGKQGLRNDESCYASWHSLNGNGEMTGTTWIEESGLLEGPIAITNSHSVGTVRDAIIKWCIENRSYNVGEDFWLLPVVAETYDGKLNDINGFHVKDEHVFHAINSASSETIHEGNVGGGTGMICHGFKGGIGTSSRKINVNNSVYTVGVLVQANYGRRKDLTITGLPVGKEISELMPKYQSLESKTEKKTGSIIVVVATNAPLLPYQLKRLVKRVPIGIGRLGGYGSHSSGDIFISFSTANYFSSKKR